MVKKIYNKKKHMNIIIIIIGMILYISYGFYLKKEVQHLEKNVIKQLKKYNYKTGFLKIESGNIIYDVNDEKKIRIKLV